MDKFNGPCCKDNIMCTNISADGTDMEGKCSKCGTEYEFTGIQITSSESYVSTHCSNIVTPTIDIEYERVRYEKTN